MIDDEKRNCDIFFSTAKTVYCHEIVSFREKPIQKLKSMLTAIFSSCNAISDESKKKSKLFFRRANWSTSLRFHHLQFTWITIESEAFIKISRKTLQLNDSEEGKHSPTINHLLVIVLGAVDFLSNSMLFCKYKSIILIWVDLILALFLSHSCTSGYA